MTRPSNKAGKVYLVGAGPGDPDLITLRGRELLESADRVVYDALVDPYLLEYVRPEAEKLFAGKRGVDPEARQRAIDRLLVEGARQGLVVVRLKGGDPFVFGRGGEEAEVLAREGVEFEIVPGVSSMIAGPAYAGIPLTHRAHASSVFIATGHEDPERPAGRLRWEVLARSADTLLFMMSIRNLGAILSKLQEHGRDASTPAALIERATWPRQRTVVGTLSTLEEKARLERISPPALLVVGDVVSVRESTAWFERRPLFGRRVLITRARHQAAPLRRLLREAGAEVVEFPTIEIHPPSSWGPADKAIGELEAYDWVLFTSANGVDAFFDRLWKKGRDLRALSQARLGAIGPATARRLEEHGLRPDVIPREFRAEGVLEALHNQVRGARILLARAREAREVLPRQLREVEGAQVDVIEVYRSELPQVDTSELRRELEQSRIDVVTFTSSSSVKNLARLLNVKSLSELLVACEVGCIGPITSDTARAHGLSPSIEPEQYTIPALAMAVIDRFKSSPSGTRPPR